MPCGNTAVYPSPGCFLGTGDECCQSDKARLQLRPTLTGSFQGNSRAFRASLANEILPIFVGLIAVDIIAGVLQDSNIHTLKASTCCHRLECMPF